LAIQTADEPPGNLGDEVLEVMLLGFESGDLSTLDNKRDGGTFSLVGDDIIGNFDCDDVDTALGALGADFFGGESAGFAGIVGGDTAFDLADFGVPEAFTDLSGDEDFQNLVGNLFGDGLYPKQTKLVGKEAA